MPMHYGAKAGWSVMKTCEDFCCQLLEDVHVGAPEKGWATKPERRLLQDLGFSLRHSFEIGQEQNTKNATFWAEC